MNLKFRWIAVVAMIFTIVPAVSQIKTGQAIRIVIQGVKAEEQERINGVYPVSETGMVNMPFVGPVKAAGLKPAALQVELEAAYKRAGIYLQPTFQVIASDGQEIDQQVVHIGGHVKRNGQVKFIQGLTLFQAIQVAGGPTEFGSMRRVRVYRDGRAHQHDLTKAEGMQVKLNQGDTVVVPQKNWIGQ